MVSHTKKSSITMRSRGTMKYATSVAIRCLAFEEIADRGVERCRELSIPWRTDESGKN